MIPVEKVGAVVLATGWGRLLLVDAHYHAYHLHAAMEMYEVDTLLRAAAFLAQWAHETGGWRWMRELGGPSYFTKYDFRKDLGNTESGDGYRFRGRGYCMLTGRYNYDIAGRKLNLPLIEQPDLAASLPAAARIAGQYWVDNGLNEYADEGKIKTITLKINGGLNGYADRKSKYEIAKGLLK